jgi:hypothetical protein
MVFIHRNGQIKIHSEIYELMQSEVIPKRCGVGIRTYHLAPEVVPCVMPLRVDQAIVWNIGTLCLQMATGCTVYSHFHRVRAFLMVRKLQKWYRVVEIPISPMRNWVQRCLIVDTSRVLLDPTHRLRELRSTNYSTILL